MVRTRTMTRAKAIVKARPVVRTVTGYQRNLTCVAVNRLLSCTDVPHVHAVLEDMPHFCTYKCNDVIAACLELSRFLNGFIPKYFQEFNTENHQQNQSLVIAITSFLDCAFELSRRPEVCSAINKLANLLILNVEHVQPEVASLCEKLIYAPAAILEGSIVIGALLQYYLLVCLRGGPIYNDENYSRLWKICKLVPSSMVRHKDILVLIYTATRHLHFLTTRAGHHILGFFMSRAVVLAKKMHTIIKEVLKIDKQGNYAINCGTVYVIAWAHAAPETQKVIKEFIQDIWELIFKAMHVGKDLTPCISNGLHVLKSVHSFKHYEQFSKELTDLYAPILWRKLASGKASERALAAIVFLDLFPLEKPYASRVEKSAFTERQANDIIKLLRDESQAVRTVAVRCTLSAIVESVKFLTIGQLKEIYECIFIDNTDESSTSVVRVAVLEGVAFLIEGLPDYMYDNPNSPTWEFVQPVLSCLDHLFFDKNVAVRDAYVKLLLKIKEKPWAMEIQYTQVQPLEKILLLLQHEQCIRLCERISKLVKELIYLEDKPLLNTVERIMDLIKLNFEGLKKFFQYSKETFTDFEVYSLVVFIMGFISDKLEQLEEASRSGAPGRASGSGSSSGPSGSSAGRSGSSAGPSGSSAGPSWASAGPSTSAGPSWVSAGPSTSAGPSWSSAGPSTSAGPSWSSAGPSTSAGSSSSCAGPSWSSAGPSTSAGPSGSSAGPSGSSAGPSGSSAGACGSSVSRPGLTESIYAKLDDHRNMSGLIQIAATVISTFYKEINDDSAYKNTLINVSSRTIQSLLKHYKGTDVYFTIVNYASNIPLSDSSPVFITLCADCMNELKQISESDGNDKIATLVYALFSWNCGNDVLQLIHNWLKIYFEEILWPNSKAFSIKKMPANYKQDALRYKLALKVLSILFSGALNISWLVNKHYKALFSLFSSMEKITVIVDNYLNDQSSLNAVVLCSVTEDLVYGGFFWYIRLINILHKPNISIVPNSIPSFESAPALTTAVTLAYKSFLKHIPSRENNNDPSFVGKCCLVVLNESRSAIDLKITNQKHILAFCIFLRDLLAHDDVPWFVAWSVSSIRSLVRYAMDKTPDDEWQLLKTVLPSLLEKALLVLTNSQLTEITLKHVIKDVPRFTENLFSLSSALLQKYDKDSEIFLETFKNITHGCIMLVQKEIINENKVVLRKKLEEHPYLASNILLYALSKREYKKLILKTIEHLVYLLHKDGYKMLACLSVLYTFVHTKGVPRLELEDVLCYIHYAMKFYLKNQEPRGKRPNKNDSENISRNWMRVADPIFKEIKDTYCVSLDKVVSVPLNQPISEPKDYWKVLGIMNPRDL